MSPVDGSVWGTVLGFPGAVIRVDPGPDPTPTAPAEIFEPAFPGYGRRGGATDRKGVYWASFASGHLARFDRHKMHGPQPPDRDRQALPEGWTLYPFSGPQFRDVPQSGSAEASY